MGKSGDRLCTPLAVLATFKEATYVRADTQTRDGRAARHRNRNYPDLR